MTRTKSSLRVVTLTQATKSLSVHRSIQIMLLLAMLVFTAARVQAQNMSVNSTGAKPDNSAMLDVSSTNKGALFPRMTLAQRNAINNPAHGLLIFQTDNIPGFWVYDTASTNWIKILTSSDTTAQNLSGVLANGNDAGGDSIVNVTGLGIGTANPSTRVEIFNNTDNNSTLTITNERTSGSPITVFQRARTGQTAVANNDFIGVLSFTGFDGTSYEQGALIRAQVDGIPGTGSMPTSLNFLTTPDGTATAIRRMRITEAGNIGIGTSTPDSLLDVNGAATIDRLNINSAFTFPNVDGGANQVLTTDGFGNVTWEDAGGNDTLSFVQDTDGDTKIQTEENTDEDIIRFDVDGTEVLRIHPNSRMQVANTVSGLFIGSQAGSSISSGAQNTFLGYEAGANTSNTSNSTYVGYRAGYTANGASNTSIGALSGDALTSGTNNTFLGMQAGTANNTGTDNVFLGKNAGRINTTGGQNLYIGTGAGDQNNGSGNVFIGHSAASTISGVSNQLYLSNSSDVTPLIYGDFAADSIVINGRLTLDSSQAGAGYTFPGADGTAGDVLQTDGAGNLDWVPLAGATSPWTTTTGVVNLVSSTNDVGIGTSTVTSSYKAEIGFSGGANSKGLYINNASSGGGGGTKMGVNVLLTEAGVTNRVAYGAQVFGKNSGSDSICVVHGKVITNNASSKAFGLIVDFPSNLGTQYGVFAENEDYNYFSGSVGIGTSTPLEALQVDSFLIMDGAGVNGIRYYGYNIYSDGSTYKYAHNGAASAYASDNEFTGLFRWQPGTAGGNVPNDATSLIRMEDSTITFNTVADDSNFNMKGHLMVDSLSVGSYNFPIADGSSNHVLTTDGSGNVTWQPSSGGDTLSFIEDGDGDTKIQVEESNDEDTIRFDMNGTEYFRMGNGRFEIVNTGISTFIGRSAGQNDDGSDNENVFIGDSAGRDNIDGDFNTFVGAGAGSSANSSQNTAIGNGAMRDLTSGSANTVVGDWAMRSGNGSGNTVMGSEAFLSRTGSNNVAIGEGALGSTSSIAGSNNVALGAGAGSNNPGSNNVMIGYQAGSSGNFSNTLYIDNGTGSPLIYGDFANDTVKIYGTLGIDDAFHFPVTDGSANQVLTTDGAGNVSWSTATGTQDIGSVLGYGSDAAGDSIINLNHLSIATSNGNYPLTIQADENNLGAIWQVFDTTGVSAWHTRLQGTNYQDLGFTESGVSDDRLVLQAGGNVGFGVANPEADFHINMDTLRLSAPSNFSGAHLLIKGARHNSGSGIATIDFRNTDSSDGNTEYSAAKIQSTNPGSSDDGDLRFYTTDDLTSSMAMIIDQTGNVGIGTSSPGSLLEVASSSDSVNVRINGGSASDAETIEFGYNAGANRTARIRAHNLALELAAANGRDITFNTKGSQTGTGLEIGADVEEIMRIDGNGNVGIGTSSPDVHVHIDGGSDVSFTDGSGYLLLGDQDNNNIAIDDNEIMARNNAGEGILYLQNDGGGLYIQNQQAGGTQVIIEDNGDVGLGTTPAAKFHVNGKGYFHNGVTSAPSVGTTGGNGDRLILWPGSAGSYPYSMGITGSTMWYSVPSSAIHSWYTGGTERMRITSGGAIGIGTTSPSDVVHVRNSSSPRFRAETTSNSFAGFVAENSNGEYFMGVQSTADGTSGEFHIFQNAGSGNSGQRMVIDHNGRMGIGVSDPTHILHINGAGRSTSSLWATTSDARAKQDIETIASADDLLLKLRPVTFLWTPEYHEGRSLPTHTQYGFISQEVEKVMPEMVMEVEEVVGNDTITDFKILDKDPLLALLVRSAQEQNQEINALKQTNATLMEEVAALKHLLSLYIDHQDPKPNPEELNPVMPKNNNESNQKTTPQDAN